MYVTAHRVQEPKGKESAVHVFVHLHDSDDLFTSGKEDIELLRQVTEQEPGRLVAKDLTFPAGGNAVLSYVDVIARDATPLDDILAALDGFRDRVAAGPLPNYGRYGNVLVSFGAVFGLQGVEVREYDHLHESLKAFTKLFYAKHGG